MSKDKGKPRRDGSGQGRRANRGSGSTLIACEQTGRRCFMMEIDPRYCQIIVDRWEAYTGQKSTKIEETQ